MSAPFVFCERRRKPDHKCRAALETVDLQFSAKLSCCRDDHFHPKRVGLADLEIIRHAASLIGDRQFDHILAADERHMDRARRVGRIGMFECIGDQLVREHGERDRVRTRQLQRLDVDGDCGLMRAGIGVLAFLADQLEEARKLDVVRRVGLVEIAIDRAHRDHAVARAGEVLARGRVADIALLHLQHARQQRQRIHHAMLQFAQQKAFLLHKVVDVVRHARERRREPAEFGGELREGRRGVAGFAAARCIDDGADRTIDQEIGRDPGAADGKQHGDQRESETAGIDEFRFRQRQFAVDGDGDEQAGRRRVDRHEADDFEIILRSFGVQRARRRGGDFCKQVFGGGMRFFAVVARRGQDRRAVAVKQGEPVARPPGPRVEILCQAIRIEDDDDDAALLTGDVGIGHRNVNRRFARDAALDQRPDRELSGQLRLLEINAVSHIEVRRNWNGRTVEIAGGIDHGRLPEQRNAGDHGFEIGRTLGFAVGHRRMLAHRDHQLPRALDHLRHFGRDQPRHGQHFGAGLALEHELPAHGVVERQQQWRHQRNRDQNGEASAKAHRANSALLALMCWSAAMPVCGRHFGLSVEGG